MWKNRNIEDIVYIIGEDNMPISISIGELVYSKVKLGISYEVFNTFDECLKECNKRESTL